MKAPKKHWAFADAKKHSAERMSSLMFFFFEFAQKANEEDVDSMLQLLCDWSEADDVPCWFTTCVFNFCGVATLCPSYQQPRTLTQFRTALKKHFPGPNRADFVAMHLDLRSADKYERAFLALCQAVYREAHLSHKPINAGDLLQKATNIALDDVIKGSRRRRRKTWPTRSASRSKGSQKERTPHRATTNTSERFCPTEGHGPTTNWRYDFAGNCEVCNDCNSRVVKLTAPRRKTKY